MALRRRKSVRRLPGASGERNFSGARPSAGRTVLRPEVAMRTRFPLAALVLAALTAPPAAAQQYMSKTTFAGILEHQKSFLLQYVDAAPDSMLGWRPVPGVRSFAEQIEHAAFSDAFVGHMLIVGNRDMPSFGDSTVYRRSKAALREAVTRAMDHTIEMINGVTDAQMMEEVSLFGRRMPRHRALLLLLDHFPWTLGQTVPYLRMHGVTPPPYTVF